MSSSFRHERVQATGAGRAAVWAAANDGSEDSKYWSDHAVQAVSVSLVGGGESNNNEIVLTNHETAATDSCTGLAVGTKYYCTVSRPVAGTVQVSIYTGGPRGTLVDTLSVSVDASRAWRYLYGCNSYNSASPSSTLTFDVEHLAVPVDRATDFYYNESWQVLEERRDAAMSASAQYLWDQRYIDAPVLRWRDADADAGNGLEETLYYCNDANMSITALVDQASGAVVERNIYTSYGEPTFMDGEWQLTVVAGFTDGTASAFGNTRLFTGLPLDSETGLCLARERYDHPTLGGWTSRDRPYIDGMNMYVYCGDDPVGRVDPFGRVWWNPLSWFSGDDEDKTPGENAARGAGEGAGEAAQEAAKSYSEEGKFSPGKNIPPTSVVERLRGLANSVGSSAVDTMKQGLAAFGNSVGCRKWYEQAAKAIQEAAKPETTCNPCGVILGDSKDPPGLPDNPRTPAGVCQRDLQVSSSGGLAAAGAFRSFARHLAQKCTELFLRNHPDASRPKNAP